MSGAEGTPTPSAEIMATKDIQYRMTLFVAGDEANSRTAWANISDLCEEELKDCCDIEIVDVLEHYAAAAQNGIVVTPTLLIHEPGPQRKVIGNLSNREKLFSALGLEVSEK